MPLPTEITDAIQPGAGGTQGYGSVAQRLLSGGMRINQLRTLDVLRKDEWKHFDTAVVEVARKRLVGVGALLSAGLRYGLSNPLGTTQIEWEQVSDMNDASISMSGVTDGQKDRVTYTLKSLPIPIVHKEFDINARVLAASRTRGDSLDTTQAEVAARKVAEMNESILFNGATITVSGQTVPGYTTAANRNTGSLTSDWSDTSGTKGEDIISDVIAMMGKLKADNMYGPYELYVPVDYYNRLLDDYKADSDKTILARILEIPDITAVRQTKDLVGGSSGEVLLVQMTSDVVQMIDGMQPTPIQWESHGGLIFNFKVMSIMIPRIRADALGQSGIAHYSL